MERKETAKNPFEHVGLLLVDDQKAARLLLRAYCQRLGVGRVEEATDSIEALRMLMQTDSKRTPYDAIFLSRSMREMNGLELVRNIRQLSGWIDFPVVVISEDLDPSLARDAKSAGATDYMIRPYTEETLKSMLEQILAIESKA